MPSVVLGSLHDGARKTRSEEKLKVEAADGVVEINRTVNKSSAQLHFKMFCLSHGTSERPA